MGPSPAGDPTGQGLSRREVEVLRLLAAGKTRDTAATELGISPHTLAEYLASARRKLGAATTIHAVAMLIRAEKRRHHRGEVAA